MKMKKIFCLILVLVAVVSCFGVSAVAAYDEVLVSEMTDANNVKHTYYADDMYGYDIVWSQSSYAASGCAKAFSDKYITGNYPDLKLPITSLPYYGPY